MKRLIVRADDLGYSEGVNCGIAHAVSGGVARSVGVMANMPAVSHGLSLLGEANVALGLHACVSAGSPVCPPGEVPSLVGADGAFLQSSAYRQGEARPVQEEIEHEVRAQLRRLEGLIGRRPDYMDVHAVESDVLFRAVAAVAREEGILAVMAAPSDDETRVGSVDMQVMMPTASARSLGEARELFVDALSRVPDDGCTLAVFHPGYIDLELSTHSSLVERRPIEAALLADPELAVLLTNLGFELTDFRSL